MVKKSKKGIVDPVVETQPPVEEFTGSDLQPQPDAPRPKTTPYATSPIALRIGPQQTPYYAPQRLLQNPDWVGFDNSWGNEIKLPDVDEVTGHVLIHYLYTGAYQTLDDIELSPIEAVRVEFRRAVIAYIAAKKYMLHGLQRLAGEKISTFGAEMSIFDVVEAINKDFSRIPDDATWFHKYMSDKVRTAFEQDPTVFTRDDLFGRIDNVALIRVLAKVMVEVYTKKLSPVLSTMERLTPEIQKGGVIEERVLPSDKPPRVEGVNINEAPGEECQAGAFAAKGTSIKAGPAQEALVQASPDTSTALVGDGQDVTPIKKLKKTSKKELMILRKKKMKEAATIVEAPPVDPEPTPQPMLEADPALVKEDDASPDSGTPCPIKKKKGKKHAIIGIEEGTKAEDAPPLPVEYPTPVEGEYTEVPPVIEESLPSPPLKHVREPEPEPVPEPEPELEPEPVAKKKKKGKRGSMLATPPEPEPEPMPEVESVPEVEPVIGEEPGVPEQDDPWGALSASSLSKKKGKKGKKGRIEAVIEAIPPSPPPEPIPEPEPVVEELLPHAIEEPRLDLAEHNSKYNGDIPASPPTIPLPEPEPKPTPTEGPDWGLSSIWGAGKKKKKGKKGAVPSPPLPASPEPVPEPEPIVEGLSPPAVGDPGLELAEHNINYNEEVPATSSEIPVPEPEPAIIEGDEWGLSPTWGGGKKKKKSKKATAVVPPPPPEPFIEVQDIHDPDPASTATMVAESAPVEESITAQPNSHNPLPMNSPVHPPVEPESTIEADIGYCPRRAKHIGKSDRWKTCEQCRVFLRQIAVEFVRTGSPIETGYEIVDRTSNGL